MEAYTIDVKVSHGKVTVFAKGRTGRGQSYIKDSKALDVESISDPKFKAELAAAVKQLLASDA